MKLCCHTLPLEIITHISFIIECVCVVASFSCSSPAAAVARCACTRICAYFMCTSFYHAGIAGSELEYIKPEEIIVIFIMQGQLLINYDGVPIFFLRIGIFDHALSLEGGGGPFYTFVFYYEGLELKYIKPEANKSRPS